jgi:hypothetical protein
VPVSAPSSWTPNKVKVAAAAFDSLRRTFLARAAAAGREKGVVVFGFGDGAEAESKRIRAGVRVLCHDVGRSSHISRSPLAWNRFWTTRGRSHAMIAASRALGAALRAVSAEVRRRRLQTRREEGLRLGTLHSSSAEDLARMPPETTLLLCHASGPEVLMLLPLVEPSAWQNVRRIVLVPDSTMHEEEMHGWRIHGNDIPIVAYTDSEAANSTFMDIHHGAETFYNMLMEDQDGRGDDDDDDSDFAPDDDDDDDDDDAIPAAFAAEVPAANGESDAEDVVVGERRIVFRFTPIRPAARESESESESDAESSTTSSDEVSADDPDPATWMRGAVGSEDEAAGRGDEELR